MIGTLGVGGAERQLVLTCRALKERGVESHVAFLREPSVLSSELDKAGVRSTGFGLGPKKRVVPMVVPRLRQLIREFQPDVVHTSLVPADIAGGLAAVAEGVPAVSTLCAIAGRLLVEDNPYQSLWKSKLQTELWGAVLRRTHREVIAISGAVKETALTDFHFPEERVSVVYRAIHEATSIPPLTSKEREQLRASIGAAPEESILLAVGRLVPVKGHRYLIQAFARLRRRGRKVRLWIAGEGWLRPELEKEAQLCDVSDSVVFLGRRLDVPQLIRACDIFAFPSLHEGLGVALLEAASMGKPIVTTDRQPMTEIIEHGRSGLCVPMKSTDMLAEALERLVDDPEYARRLGQQAEECSRKKFHVDEMMDQLLNVYDRVSSARS